MSDIIATTSPNSEGEMLWCVYYKSSYYDNDPRMPGTVPVDQRTYTLAKSRDEAISKAEPEIKKARKQSDKDAGEDIEATIVTLEALIPARDSKNDGRMGWISTEALQLVQLSHPSDVGRYRIGVCLIPIK